MGDMSAMPLGRYSDVGRLADEVERSHERVTLTRDGEPVAVAGLDHRGVHVRRARTVQLHDHGLVARTSDHVLEERADVVVGLDDQDPRHVRIFSRARRYPVSLQV